MTRQHAIERAEFDTTLAMRIDPRQQASLDDFVRTELMRVVDDVFDDIDGKIEEAMFCLDRLEIDLGEINLRDYRQQMPQRLRRQLWQALDNARFAGAGGIEQVSRQSANSGLAPVLQHYLRYGYLPAHAAVTDAAELEALLRSVIETAPRPLLEYIAGSVNRDAIIERLRSQFTAGLVGRIEKMIASGDVANPAATPIDADSSEPSSTDFGAADVSAEGTASIDVAAADTSPTDTASKAGIGDETAALARAEGGAESIGAIFAARLEAALATNRQASLQRLWPSLLRQEAAILAAVLRATGRHSRRRQQLARLLSATQFSELVRLIEPNAHALVLALLQNPRWLSPAAELDEAGMHSREFLLGYLLVERSRQFDRAELSASLVNQAMAAKAGSAEANRRRLRTRIESAPGDDDLSRELARLLLTAIDRDEAAADVTDVAAAYSRYARVASLFAAGSDGHDENLAADIDLLMRQTPWLMLRLVRELQVTENWRPGLRRISEMLLRDLVKTALNLFDQVVTDKASAGSAELSAAIERHARRARDRQAYFAEIFYRIVKDDLIDFEQLDRAESHDRGEGDDAASFPAAVDADPRDRVTQSPAWFADRSAARALHCAELLAAAGLSAGFRLSPSRLDEIKWRLLQSWFDASGVVFDLPWFARRMIETLVAEAGVESTREVYSRIAQALLGNSLPASRDLIRQLIDVLHDIAADIAPASRLARGVTQSPTDSTIDEAMPTEDIHVDNAGLVLLAPWLPRLFEQLDLLEDGRFKDRAAAERAVHCAQFLVDGSSASPEFRLVLNKLLCGVRPGKPIRRSIELSGVDVEQLEGLLTAVTQHWKALENTSIDGLRESFLKRGGRLQRKQDAWHLQVEARAFDMLLDQVPWSYSTIKFAWMERVIYVDWR